MVHPIHVCFRDFVQDNYSAGAKKSENELFLAPFNDVTSEEHQAGDFVSVDKAGCLRMWQVVPDRVRSALSRWRDLVGHRKKRFVKYKVLLNNSRIAFCLILFRRCFCWTTTNNRPPVELERPEWSKTRQD